MILALHKTTVVYNRKGRISCFYKNTPQFFAIFPELFIGHMSFAKMPKTFTFPSCPFLMQVSSLSSHLKSTVLSWELYGGICLPSVSFMVVAALASIKNPVFYAICLKNLLSLLLLGKSRAKIRVYICNT